MKRLDYFLRILCYIGTGLCLLIGLLIQVSLKITFPDKTDMRLLIDHWQAYLLMTAFLGLAGFHLYLSTWFTRK